jgi:ubiquinone/menaquinone biosynthesis C-methylase UbiE
MDNIDGLEYTYSYAPCCFEYLSLPQIACKLRELAAPYRFKLAAKCIIKELSINKNAKILEIGSGLGLLGKAIKELTNGEVDYFGIELAYKSAQASSEKGLFEVQADAVNLPFADSSFDIIISADVLEHIPNSEQTIKEIYRVLKENGRAFIVIADPSEPRFNKVKEHIKRSDQKTDVDYWENLFERNGFYVNKESEKYRRGDWRKIFNLPILRKLKDMPVFACAFNMVYRPGVYIISKTKITNFPTS